MATGFTLLEDDAIYLEQIEEVDGYWEGGIYYTGTETTTYIEFDGEWEPYGTNAEESIVLPSGISSSSAVILVTEQSLTTYVSVGTSTDADIIYLEDPEEDDEANRWIIYSVAKWKKNSGYTLLGSTHFEYLCIREEEL